MEEKKIKKKKLTLSVSSKTLHNVPNYVKSRQKTSVLIEKKAPRRWGEKKFQSRDNNFNKSKSTANFIPKKTRINRNVDIRKMAEERATNRFKNLKEDSLQPKKSSLGKDKGFTSKREQKLTLSKALDDEVLDGRERSLASVRRARLKEKKNQDSEKAKIETKKIVHEVNIPGKITIQELSNRMAMQASNIIKHLLGMGVVATINHTIDADTAEYLVKEFGNIPIREKKPDLNILKPEKKDNKNLKSRPPIVTVMGHVDHGKTSLLDALRNTNIVAQEHGGITQHIGAYRVKTEKGKSITFIDTPGHAAFTEMRARGSKVTDIVVLVVAADDGVKPQTIEAIKHAKAAKVPIIVAINKCDLPAADPQKIKNELLQYELIAEELSGDTLFAEVSAITKKNLDKLKENITLQSDLLDLTASFEGFATGVILESRIDKGKGSVSTVLIISGNLEKGNYFVSGNTWGKIRAMINDQGQNIDSALPSTPVEILGMNNSAFAGDDFIVVDSEEKAKKINEYRIKDLKSKQAPLISANKESAFDDTATPEELSIIIKSDVHGSSEALKNAIEKIKHKFDYILIDCPPALGILTVNALTAADSIIVPMQCEFYSLEGLSHLVHTINRVKKTYNPHLTIQGLVLTMVDKRNSLTEQVKSDIKSFFGKKSFFSSILQGG